MQRQIKQMVMFIKQEANEKANEIAVSAEEEFNIEKLQMVEGEKQKIRKEFERKEQQIDIKKKIEYSTKLNQARLKSLQARNDAVQTVYANAREHLKSVGVAGPAYKKLLVELLAQSYAKLKEPALKVRCRECDVSLVTEAVESAKQLYKQLHPKEQAPTVVIDKTVFLPPPPSATNTVNFCSGGVLVASADGKITCKYSRCASGDLFPTELTEHPS